MSKLANKVTLTAILLSSTGCANIMPEVEAPGQRRQETVMVEKETPKYFVMFHDGEKETRIPYEMLKTPEYQALFGKQILEHNAAYFAEHPESEHKPAWDKLLEFIDNGEKLLVDADEKGLYAGVDGYDSSLREFDRSTENVVDSSEMLPNYQEVSYNFPFAKRRTLSVPTLQETDVIKETKEISNGTFGVGAEMVAAFTAADDKYNFGGNMIGAGMYFTFQPRSSNWYFGRELLFYGNDSAVGPLESSVPAEEGPLAGKLVLEGENNYSLEAFGFGSGGIIGYKPSKYVGLELHAGLLHDWITTNDHEFSQQFINGSLVEGSDETNNQSKELTQFFLYHQLGLRFALPYIDITPTVGFKTNLEDTYFIGTLGIGYKSE